MPQEYDTSESIVAGITQGDRKAETALIEKYSRALMYSLIKRTGDKEKAEDLCQEACLIVLQRLRNDSLSDPTRLSAYIHQTAINLHIGQIRKEVRQNTTVDTDLLEALALTEGNQYSNLMSERRSLAVNQIIKELGNVRDRKILVRFYIDEVDKESICKELDLSVRQFDRVISRARLRFRDVVECSQEIIPLEITT